MAATWLVTSKTLNLRAAPTVADDNVLAELPMGTIVVTATDPSSDWAAVTAGASQGFVSVRYLVRCELPSPRPPAELAAVLPEATLTAIMPELPADLRAAYLPWLRAAMLEFHIVGPARGAAFLAQLAHESDELRRMEEGASGAAYEGRRDLGNTHRGDGVRYKGRGPIQLTGRANYRAYGARLGVDLEAWPLLAATPQVGFRVAGAYWAEHGLNELADVPGNFKLITKEINGGYNGLDDRLAYYAKAQAAFAAAAGPPGARPAGAPRGVG